MKNDSPNIILSKIVTIVRLDQIKRLSTAQRDFRIVIGPPTLDLNYEFTKDVAGRIFSNCCVLRKLSTGEVM